MLRLRDSDAGVDLVVGASSIVSVVALASGYDVCLAATERPQA